MPGMRHELEPVPGIDDGGKLVVSGPNVMLGYLRADNPGVLLPAGENGYDTGDIVSVDAEGYVTILGRVKRFAKIAGEMVSLAAVEVQIASLWPDYGHAVVNLPDSRKGEQLVLVTEYAAADRDALQAHIRAGGGTELMVPKSIVVTDKIPVLGSGKTDYVGVGELAQTAAG
jgi:acyl-[acyl-carrier-protein]-phospholipid O-acyltransferase/long-chain-fatty-acid--[acyl-carrier-protein] ligase